MIAAASGLKLAYYNDGTTSQSATDMAASDRIPETLKFFIVEIVKWSSL